MYNLWVSAKSICLNMAARDAQVAGAVWDFTSLIVYKPLTPSGKYKKAVLILADIDV